MEEEFVVKGAMATCMFGVAPAMINVTDNTNVYINGNLVATTMTIGPVFQSPAFGTCNMVPNMPKPCAAAITKWDMAYTGMKINRISNPLTKNSRGTCALGCPMCISFTMTGQFPKPDVPLPKVAKVEHQSDMNPLATNEKPTKEDKPKPIVVDSDFVDGNGNCISDVPENGIMTLRASTKNADPGQTVTFTITNKTSGGSMTATGSVAGDGNAYAFGVDVNSLLKRDKPEDIIVTGKI